MKQKQLGRSSMHVAAIGQGCEGLGGMGDIDAARDARQLESLRLGIELGMTFIDTAEVYGQGRSEELIGKAISGIREKAFVATKFAPENNGRDDVVAAAERSLRRLRSDYIDLYQVHWPNPSVPIQETMEALSALVRQGKVRHVGVSNFSVPELEAAMSSLPGVDIVSNQVEYNLFDRFIEKRILPFCAERNMMVIAYSPLDKGRFSSGTSLLGEIARKYAKTQSQVVLNWLIRHPQVLVIPRSTNPEHVRENATAADFELSDADAHQIGAAFSAEPALVPVDEISVSVRGEGNRRVYQTLEQALKNELNFVPSPRALADDIVKGEPVKPVRLVPAGAGAGHRYDLIEGRIRYWAWVIAHSGKQPIPALIRQSR